MLSLNLKSIRSAEERFEQVYGSEQLGRDGDGFKLAAPVRLAFDVYKTNDRFRLVGKVEATVELECSRCLEPLLRAVETNFDLRYQPHSLNTGEGEREIEEDDLTTAFYENDTIDLGQLILEQLYLALPMKPLCAADCKGLCPVCGANLNIASCSCTSPWDDPRLAALKELQGSPTQGKRH